MRTRIAVALLAAVLPVPVALAQRRPVVGPGQTQPKPPEQTPEPKPEPMPEPPPPAAAVQPDAGPAKAAAPQLPAAPPKPEPPPPPPEELVFRRRFNKWNFNMKMRPGDPQPNRTVEVVFEITRKLESPDPVYGDRRPEESKQLLLAVRPDTAKAVAVTYALHPTLDAGNYGVRFMVPQKGQYRLELSEMKKPDAEVGELALQGEFTIGVGEPTIMRTEEADPGSRIAVGAGRRALRAGSDDDSALEASGLQPVMRPLGKAWIRLLSELAQPKPTPAELASLAKILREQAGRVRGKSPLTKAGASGEFDIYAERLEAAMGELEKSLSSPEKAREEMAQMESAHCLRCHVKFRFDVTDDLSQWPNFPPKAAPPPPRVGKKPVRR